MGRIRRIIKAFGVRLYRSVWFPFSYISRKVFWEWWFGYGEQPFRVFIVVLVVLISTWLAYWQFGNFVLDDGIKAPAVGQPTWRDALYYSLASFSALGYGSWVLQPTGWAKWLGAVQPFVGIISAVALSISIARRITR